MTSVQPRLRYNTVGGVNGPLVILENVRQRLRAPSNDLNMLLIFDLGQISPLQRNCIDYLAGWNGEIRSSTGSSRLVGLRELRCCYANEYSIGSRAVVQVFEGTTGIDVKKVGSKVRLGETVH